MYVAVKGGERAIEAAHDWLARERRGPADQRMVLNAGFCRYTVATQACHHRPGSARR